MNKDELFKSPGGGSVYLNPKTATISVNFQSRDEIDDLWRMVDLQTGGEPLPVLTYIGSNTGNYVLLPDLEHLLLSVKILRFHCSHCYARVAQGRFDPSKISKIDRVLSCRCMAVILREDIPAPRSKREWLGFRDAYLGARIRHRAADANGNS